MATVISTISAEELDYRIEMSAYNLIEGKKLWLAPGFFRAAGITPKEFMDKMLQQLYQEKLELAQAELYANSYDQGYVNIRQWRVMITRKPEDFSFVVQATCFDWRLTLPLVRARGSFSPKYQGSVGFLTFP